MNESDLSNAPLSVRAWFGRASFYPGKVRTMKTATLTPNPKGLFDGLPVTLVRVVRVIRPVQPVVKGLN